MTRFPVLLPRIAMAPVIFLALGTMLHAQSPDDRRTRLDAFRDSLALLTDPVALKSLEREVQRRSALAHQQDPVLVLREALIVLRRGSLEDGRLFDRARKAFLSAGRLIPGEPYPDFGLGLALEAKGKWLAGTPANLGIRIGYGQFEAAARAFVEASRKDPAYTQAILELGHVAELVRDTSIAREALVALRGAVAAGAATPELELALGRFEQTLGSPDSAVAAFQRYISLGGIEALASLEIARTRLARGDPDGMVWYDRGALSDDPLVIQGYRSDLKPIADSITLEDFDRTRGSERVAWLHRFWTQRDRSDLRPDGERIVEHFRRLEYARRHFDLRNNRRYFGAADLYRMMNADVDDRGVVYIRQGEPDERISPMIFGLEPNETWVYRRTDGDLLLHFSAGGAGAEGGDIEDYRLVPSVFDLRGEDVPIDLLLLSRASVSDLYQRMLGWGANGAARAAATERSIATTGAEIGTSTDSYELRFAQPMNAVVQTLAIGERGGQPLLHVVFAIPLLPADLEGATTGIPIRLRLALFRPDRSASFWLDTATVLTKSGGVPAHAYLLGRISFPVPPGTWTYRLALQRTEVMGTVFPTDTLQIAAPGAQVPRISDLAVAVTGRAIPWEAAPGDTAFLSPFDVVLEGSTMEVYYEVYGIDPTQRYETSMAVDDRTRGKTGRNRLRFTFQDQSQGETSRIRRSIRLETLPPGQYWLEVMVRDQQGRVDRVRRGFEVIKPGR